MKSENEGISRTHSQFYQYKQLFHLITISTVIFTSDNKACVNFLFLNIPESSRRFLYILKIEMEIQLRERNRREDVGINTTRDMIRCTLKCYPLITTDFHLV